MAPSFSRKQRNNEESAGGKEAVARKIGFSGINNYWIILSSTTDSNGALLSMRKISAIDLSRSEGIFLVSGEWYPSARHRIIPLYNPGQLGCNLLRIRPVFNLATILETWQHGLESENYSVTLFVHYVYF